MNFVLREMPFLFVHLDNILAASQYKEEHIVHLQQLFMWLREHGLKITPAKCQFEQSSITFLGPRIIPQGGFPRVEAVTACLQDFLHPSTTAPIACATDSTDYALGAECEQWVGGDWQITAICCKQSFGTISANIVLSTGNCWVFSSAVSALYDLVAHHVSGKDNFVADCGWL